MRTQEQGMLTPGDLIPIFMVENELTAMAHGGEAFKSDGCAACKMLTEAIGGWANAHMISEQEEAEWRAAKAGK